MDNPFDFFDMIYCVHLPEHEERWNVALTEFDKVGIRDRVIPISAPRPHKSCSMPALKFPLGEFGCWLSHGKALGHALESGAENVLFIEDDILFMDDANERMSSVLTELPADWDILFLTGTPGAKMERVSQNIASVSGTIHGTVAYSIPRRSLLKFHDFRYQLLEEIKPLADAPTNLFAQEFNGYAAAPYLCLSYPGVSEIRNAHRDYNKRISELWDKWLGE